MPLAASGETDQDIWGIPHSALSPPAFLRESMVGTSYRADFRSLVLHVPWAWVVATALGPTPIQT